MKDIRDGEQHRSTADILSPRGTPSISLNATERLYTPQDVADRLGVSERWVRDHATRRNLRTDAPVFESGRKGGGKDPEEKLPFNLETQRAPMGSGVRIDAS